MIKILNPEELVKFIEEFTKEVKAAKKAEKKAKKAEKLATDCCEEATYFDFSTALYHLKDGAKVAEKGDRKENNARHYNMGIDKDGSKYLVLNRRIPDGRMSQERCLGAFSMNYIFSNDWYIYKD